MTAINLQTSVMYANKSIAQAKLEGTQASTRLSTGLKINSPQDNAGGAALAAQMSSRIASMQRAAINASDGIQMMETADGAMQQITDMLQRMRELSLQSTNDTWSPNQRQDLDIEFQQIKAQLLQLTQATVWNDQHLLNPHADLSKRAQPAEIVSNFAIDTSGPATGQYSFFLNGTEVSVALEDQETTQARLGKIVAAINASFNQHGVNASISPAGGLSLYTPDGRDLSGWYDPAGGALSAAHLGLGIVGAEQVTAITLSAPSAPTNLPRREIGSNYVEFTGLGLTTETITPQLSTSADTRSGAISIVGQTVYKGDGTQAVAFGTLDPVKNGLNGQPLRIVFKTEYVNGNFETGNAGDTTVAGWNIFNTPVRLNGKDTVAGFATPTDTTPSGSEPTFVNANAGFSTSLTASGLASGSTLGLKMVSSNVSTPAYGVVHGPYIVSEQAVDITAGNSVSFDWKAQGGEDSYDVYAYLLNTQTGETISLLNRTGTTTDWTRETVTVPSTGSYKFVFMSGTYDQTGGTIAGAQLFVDNVSVNAASGPYTPTSADMDALGGLVNYSNNQPPMNASLNVNGLLLQATPSSDVSQLADSLYAQIQQKISAGDLQNIRVEKSGNSLRLISTQAGKPFEVQAGSVTYPSLSLSVVEERANVSPVFLVDAIDNASIKSTGARVVKGTPLTEETLSELEAKSLQIGDRQTDVIRFKLPNFGPTGTILRGLVWDIAASEKGFADSPLFRFMGDVQTQVTAKLSDPASAHQALSVIDQALQKTLDARASLGALVNRLGHVLDNLASGNINTKESLSGVQDADYGQETARLNRAQLMEQVAMWALKETANYQGRILKLLA